MSLEHRNGFQWILAYLSQPLVASSQLVTKTSFFPGHNHLKARFPQDGRDDPLSWPEKLEIGWVESFRASLNSQWHCEKLPESTKKLDFKLFLSESKNFTTFDYAKYAFLCE